jgi:lipopolysaccharide transport system ATP-binding protein
MSPAIRVDGLSKLYRVGARQQGYKTLRESIADAFWSPLRKLGARVRGSGFRVQKEGDNGQRLSGQNFWALKDVSFEVQPGEVVGIIGRNGAGKSTLLKILSRITEPTSGKIELRGRVGSLLEVGTGFHPELTGRENVYMNGSILGMSHREIQRKFDEIVAFAEIEDFLDTPVKRYSSGMYVRLAFAVAAHLEPEILLVDEVLAVGDANFQRKCISRMRDSACHGHTVLLVSHNMNHLVALTNRSILLERGTISRIGATTELVRHYLAHKQDLLAEERFACDRLDSAVQFRAVRVRNAGDVACTLLAPDRSIEVEFEILVREATSAQIAFRLNRSEDSLTVLTSALSDERAETTSRLSRGSHRFTCRIPSHFLVPGRYFLLIAANVPGRPAYDLIERALHFEVLNAGSLTSIDGRLGIVAPSLNWTHDSAYTLS